MTPPVEACRSCGAPIVWEQTQNHKPCPYDALVEEGEVLVLDQSHFKSCPDAQAWSKKGQPQ